MRAKIFNLIAAIILVSISLVQAQTNDLLKSDDAPFIFGDPAIIYDGKSISKDEFMLYVANIYGSPIHEFPTKKEAEEIALGYLLQLDFAQKAKDAGIDKTDQYINYMKLNEIFTLVKFYLQDQQTKAEISDEEMQKAYDEAISKIKVTTDLLISHIIVDSLEDANKIIGELNSNQITFEDAARKYSTDTFTSTKGGELNGWFSENSLQENVYNAIIELSEGQYTHSPIKNGEQYQIFKLRETRKSSLPEFSDEAVQNALKQQVMQKRLDEAVEIEKEKIKYEVLELQK